jgi:hypothetical protein
MQKFVELDIQYKNILFLIVDAIATTVVVYIYYYVGRGVLLFFFPPGRVGLVVLHPGAQL